MRTRTKLTVGLVVALGFSFTAVGIASPSEAVAAQRLHVEPAGPTITIKQFMYNPADLAAKVGQAATITNNDGFIHSVTANDGTFNLDVPANGSVALTVSKAGSFPYSCTYHPGQHNAASINVS